MPARFKVGDRVTFTNDYGVVFPGKTITEVKHFPDDGIFAGQTRYFITPTDAPWFPVAERNLALEREGGPNA